MPLFGCKHICAFRGLIAAAAAILLISAVGVIASPITTEPDADRAGLSIPQGIEQAPQDLSVAPEAPAVLPGDLDIRTDQPSLADLLGDSAAPPLASTRADLTVDRPLRGESTKPGDETLRQVLRALVTRHSFDPMMTLPSNFDPSTKAPTPSEGGRPAASGSRLLDNRAAGRVLREFVDVQSETDRDVIFSVLGMGKFVLEKSGRSGTVTLSELSSGWSATLLPAYDANSINDGRGSSSPPAGDGGGSLLLFVLRWILDFVTNPLGIILLMVAGVIALLAAIVRLTAFMRNQAALKRRSRRRRRRSSKSVAARSKTGPATR
jgi:hypothetical protein